MVLNTCIHSFVGSAREQYEKLDLLHKNMEKQYTDLGKYYVFDPRKVSAEELFGELNNFKNMFLVCFMFINWLNLMFKTGACGVDTITNESDTFLFPI